MLLWESEHLDRAACALKRAADGHPTVLAVEGEPGMGKTSFLNEVTSRADGYRVQAAEGVENDRSPFGVLSQWGVEPPSERGGQLTGSFLAAQALRALTDDASGPLLLRLDDLQWADPESVEAMIWLLRRASGDRLLVLTGSRPLDLDAHSAWQRWIADPGRATRVTLSGLSKASAATLIRARWPQTRPELALRLWEHTSGNPLYLTALLDEHGMPNLASMRVMPAPEEYARSINARLSELAGPATSLMRAIAILGGGWVSLFDAAEVAQVAAPGQAAQALVDAGLLQETESSVGASVRVAHALIRAAIYQRTPTHQRRTLHAAAARTVSDASARLEHRLAAADRYDDDLAADLERFARVEHDRRSFRVAAQYFRWSSAVTLGPAERERRRLESLFEAVLAGELGSVHAELETGPHGGDLARRTLVEGALAVVEGRELDAVRILGDLSDQDLRASDPLTVYRTEVMLAWARVAIGAPAAEILDGLRRADATGVDDPAISGYALFPRGQASARVSGLAVALDDLRALPDAPAGVRGADSYDLAWRGALRYYAGYFEDARADLREVHARYLNGLTDITDGITHGFLGATHWFTGQWDLAKVSDRLALDVASDRPSPILHTFTPLRLASVGEFDHADRLLDRATDALTEMPWPEGVLSLVTARVVRLHAGGSAAARAGLLPAIRHRWPAAWFDSGIIGAPWLMHATIAATWANETAWAHDLLDQLGDLRAAPHWAESASWWLRGLVAEAVGQPRLAFEHVQRAVAAGMDDLPLYAAHALFDYARLARALDRGQLAQDAIGRAEARYRALGAEPYLRKVAIFEPRPAQQRSTPSIAVPLSDRERDVLTLVVAGLSYAQIAKDLFITRSTVGYHLSHLYAKTNVTSRHELTALVRKDPAPFRLEADASMV